MMKSSCIAHPPKQRLILIREWQMTFCGGNACAAALLSFFEYWHNIKLEQAKKAREMNATAERHGEAPTQDETMVQFHSSRDLKAGIMIYSDRAITDAIHELEQSKVLTVMANPNPRYRFDKTRHFIFHPEIVNGWLAEYYPDSAKTQHPHSESAERYGQNATRYDQSARAIPETSSETSIREQIKTTSSLSGHGDGTKEIPSEEVNVPFQAIIKAYNDSIGPNEDTSKVISLTDARRRHILARWGEPLYRTNWQRLFKMRGESDHLCGRTKSEGHENFRGDFDWLHKNNANYVKVLEGKYRNRKRRAPGTMTKEEDDAAAAKAIREGKERKAYYDSFPKFHLPPGFTASDLGRTKSGGGDTPKPDGGSRGEQNTSG